MNISAVLLGWLRETHAVLWFRSIPLALILIVGTAPTPPLSTTQATPDIRFILQTQAGLSAYATITDTISLPMVRPLFSTIEIENSEYIQGEYTLASRTDRVKLAIGSAGWAIAWHTRDVTSPYLYDCLADPTDTGLPEKALLEVSNALGITGTVASFYDFRNPEATGIILHWLFLPGGGNLTSSITLPLLNTYIERGYVFCTALSNSKLRLNGQIVDQQGAIYEVVRRYGPLGADQLRAGQTNAMKIEALTLFGYGFIGGVTAEYSGTTTISTSGGYTRILALGYPTSQIGDPIVFLKTYLPLMRR